MNLFRFLHALIAALLMTSTAMAQGFMVKPMRLDLNGSAGRFVEFPVEIRNTGAAANSVAIRLVDLTQTESGGWSLGDERVEHPIGPYSSIEWTSLSTDRIEIDPLGLAEFVVRADIPTNARGPYFAALLAETIPPETSGVAVRVRFLIPVIIQVSGRPTRQQIGLSDVEMTYVEGAAGIEATTKANLVIANEGRTLSRVSGEISIEKLNGDQWRPVTRIDVAERSILPGLTLKLGGDLERRLPSGEYRLRGELLVDGRRVAPFTKQIDFVGDPAGSLAYDTALLLEPSSLSVDIVPGGTRTATVTIENPGTAPVVVSMAPSTPAALLGVQLGEMKGTDLSAEPWTEVRPAEFTIRPGRRQNVRIIAHLPEGAVSYPNYYADLVLKGVYVDGQSAGETRSLVHVANTSQSASTVRGGVEQITVAQGEKATEYVVQARLANTGNVHVEPRGAVGLVTDQSIQVMNWPLSGDGGILLPFGKRSFSGTIDVAGVEPGYYALRTTFDLGTNEPAIGQIVVQIETTQVAGADGQLVDTPQLSVVTDAADIPVGTVPATEADGSEAATDEAPVATEGEIQSAQNQ